MESTGTSILLYSPIHGQIKDLSKLPNQFFFNTYGEKGIAIEPSTNCVYAPIDGQITNILNTQNSFQITSQEGVIINVYIGIGTEKLYGEGITTILKKGDIVKREDILLFFDAQLFARNKLPKTIILGIAGHAGAIKFQPKYGHDDNTEVNTILGNIIFN